MSTTDSVPTAAFSLLMPSGAVPTATGYTQVVNPNHRYLGPQSSGAKITIRDGDVLEQWYADNVSVSFDGPGTPERWRYVGLEGSGWIHRLPERAQSILDTARMS